MITEDEVTRLLAGADPARTPIAGPAIDGADFLATIAARAETDALVEPQPLPVGAGPSHRRWLVAAVVVAVGLAAVLVLSRQDDGDDHVPVVPSTTVAPVDEDALALASRFVGALVHDDPSVALELLSPDALAATWGSESALRTELAFFAATGSSADLLACRPWGDELARPDPGRVRCSYSVQLLRSRELQLGPFGRAFWDLTIRDGVVVRAERGGDGRNAAFRELLWRPLRAWVYDEHPDDAAVLFEGDDWRVTDESIPIWERLVREYASTHHRVGFIGLPPVEATPSAPARGDLVLAFYGGVTIGPRTRMWVYADGRMIRQQETSVSYGASTRSTGYLEQELSPEGVSLLVGEVVGTGMFDRDRELVVLGDVPCLNYVEVVVRDRPVHVSYSRGCAPETFERLSTVEQAALNRLDARLGDPASWLPAEAWVDQTIRPYVPSYMVVCAEGPAETASLDEVVPVTVRAVLDQAVVSATSSPMDPTWIATTGDDPGRCRVLTVEDARGVAAALESADFVQPYHDLGVRLAYAAPGGDSEPASISFEPVLPHGDHPCSACG